jgi:hypothetical protein
MPTLLDRGFSISTLTATGGEGKSYITVHDLALNRLVKYNFHLLTNLPLRVEKLAAFVALQRGCKPEQVVERIHLIPTETLERWEAGEGGPWEFFDLFKAFRFDFILDEAHRFAPAGKIDQQWQAFLGEARHPPYSLQRVQFLTQSVSKIAKPIDVHAKVRYRLEKGDTRRGFMGVQMGDLYQVIASITGTLSPLVYRVEETKDAEEKWKKNGEDSFVFRKDVFELYDTHSDAGGSSEATEHQAVPEEFERRPRLLPQRRNYNGDGADVLTLPTWAWFITRNLLAFGKLVAIFAALAIVSNGGVGYVIGGVASTMSKYIDSTIGSIGPTKEGAKRGNDNSLADSAMAAIDDPAADCGCPARAALVAELAQRVRRDREALRGLGDVVAVAPDFVSFRGGTTARVGERLTTGPFAGNVIHEIDFAGRRVRVSDGSWVRLAMGKTEAEDGAQGDALAEVRELLQRADEASAGAGETESSERSILVDRDSGTTPHRSPVDAQPANGP